jgi:hypothetical protein
LSSTMLVSPPDFDIIGRGVYYYAEVCTTYYT